MCSFMKNISEKDYYTYGQYCLIIDDYSLET